MLCNNNTNNNSCRMLARKRCEITTSQYCILHGTDLFKFDPFNVICIIRMIISSSKTSRSQYLMATNIFVVILRKDYLEYQRGSGLIQFLRITLQAKYQSNNLRYTMVFGPFFCIVLCVENLGNFVEVFSVCYAVTPVIIHDF